MQLPYVVHGMDVNAGLLTKNYTQMYIPQSNLPQNKNVQSVDSVR